MSHTPATAAGQACGVALRTLFPTDVALYLSGSLPSDARLHPEEQAITAGMVPKRLQEYLHGRDCARRALTELGVPAVAIGRSADRAPVWPAGVVGSIAHSGSVATAVVGHTTNFIGLGVDLEQTEPLRQELIAMICRPDEEVAADGNRAKLLFSIKEAVYKCLYPQLGRFIDFLDMRIELPAEGQYTAHSECAHCDPALTRRIHGRYDICDGLILTAAWIRADQDLSQTRRERA